MRIRFVRSENGCDRKTTLLFVSYWIEKQIHGFIFFVVVDQFVLI